MVLIRDCEIVPLDILLNKIGSKIPTLNLELPVQDFFTALASSEAIAADFENIVTDFEEYNG